MTIKHLFFLLASFVATVAAGQDSLAFLLQDSIIMHHRDSINRDSIARMELVQEMETLRKKLELARENEEKHLSQILKMDSVRDAMREQEIMHMLQNTQGSPVVVSEDTIYWVHVGYGNLGPSARATEEASNIRLLILDGLFHPDSMHMAHGTSLSTLKYHGKDIVTISDWDAMWYQGTDRQALAQKRQEEIAKFIQGEQNHRVLKGIYPWIRQIGLAILVMTVVAVLLYVINKFIYQGQVKLLRSQQRYLKGIKLGTYEFLTPEREFHLIRNMISIAKWVVYIVVLYISLPLLFSIFPFTKDWAQTLLAWVLNPAKGILLAFWHYLPNIFTIAVIYLVTRYIVKFLKFVATEIELGKLRLSGFHTDWALPTFNIIRILLYAFMFVVIFPYLPGSDSPVFRGVSVFLGILFSLGSSSAISNAVAGLVITYMRPFQLGDVVKIGDITGTVVEKTLLVTRIRTTKNEDVTVPNSAVLNGHTINYSSSSLERGLIVHTTITIGYDVPWREVHDLLISSALITEGISTSQQPYVLQTSLDDFYVSYQLNAFTDQPYRLPKIYSEIHSNIQDKFRDANIEIMSPHYRAERDGPSTIPNH